MLRLGVSNNLWRAIMEQAIKTHEGLDVHNDGITAAAAKPVRSPGHVVRKLAHDVNKLLKVDSP